MGHDVDQGSLPFNRALQALGVTQNPMSRYSIYTLHSVGLSSGADMAQGQLLHCVLAESTLCVGTHLREYSCWLCAVLTRFWDVAGDGSFGWRSLQTLTHCI